MSRVEQHWPSSPLSQPSEASVVEGVEEVKAKEAKVVIQMKEALQQFPSWEENRWNFLQRWSKQLWWLFHDPHHHLLHHHDQGKLRRRSPEHPDLLRTRSGWPDKRGNYRSSFRWKWSKSSNWSPCQVRLSRQPPNLHQETLNLWQRFYFPK